MLAEQLTQPPTPARAWTRSEWAGSLWGNGAETATVLAACHPIAASAREALAAHVDTQRATHGPNVWAAQQPQLCRAH
ncbi:hypothetical protein [Streptomyces chartreusis]